MEIFFKIPMSSVPQAKLAKYTLFDKVTTFKAQNSKLKNQSSIKAQSSYD
jgi:hypothetical protein